MSKLSRYVAENNCYHVTTKTKGNAPLFRDAANADIVVRALQFLRIDRAYLLGYVLMPDHLHVVLIPRGDQTISRLMRTIKGYVSRVINSERGATGSLWQPSFHDRVMRNERHLLETLEYMHRNPVTAGIASSPEEYRFSSACPQAETDIEEYLLG
jgi:REP element-mobilizing transposase RayT